MKPVSQAGYTLVELLLAMAIFSFVLLIVVGGFLLAVRQYESAVAMRKAQQNVRYGVDDITRELRRVSNITTTTASVVIDSTNPNLNTICIRKGGAVSFFQVSSGVLNRYDYPISGSCAATGTAHPVTGTDVIVKRLIASKIQVANTDPAGPAGSQEIVLFIKVTTNDNVDPATANCLPGANSAFCAAASVSTMVEARRGNQ